MSVTVRISPETREIVQRIAQESNESMQSVIAKAVEEYKRYLLIARTNEAFAALRAQPRQWAEELEERHLWNATLNDDLEEEN